MARYYGADILKTITDKLTAELNAMIVTIQTERSDSEFLEVLNITSDYSKNQLPECLVLLGDSSIDYEVITNDVNQMRDIYSADIFITFKDNSTSVYKRMEYYIEALYRVLHGYGDSNITWINCIQSTRDEYTTRENQTMKVIGVKAEIRIN